VAHRSQSIDLSLHNGIVHGIRLTLPANSDIVIGQLMIPRSTAPTASAVAEVLGSPESTKMSQTMNMFAYPGGLTMCSVQAAKLDDSPI